jgi:hypothetical protein
LARRSLFLLLAVTSAAISSPATPRWRRSYSIVSSSRAATCTVELHYRLRFSYHSRRSHCDSQKKKNGNHRQLKLIHTLPSTREVLRILLRCAVVPNIRPEATGPLLETAPLHPQTFLGNYSTLGPARHYGACIAPAQDSIRFVVSSLTVLPSYLGLVHAETRSEPSRHFKPPGPSQFPIS